MTTRNFTHSNRLHNPTTMKRLQSCHLVFLSCHMFNSIKKVKLHLIIGTEDMFKKNESYKFSRKVEEKINFFPDEYIRYPIKSDAAARFSCLRVKLIFAPLSPVLDNFFGIKRLFLKVVTAVGGPLLWWITCYVKQVPQYYSASNLALYFFSFLRNSFVSMELKDN